MKLTLKACAELAVFSVTGPWRACSLSSPIEEVATTWTLWLFQQDISGCAARQCTRRMAWVPDLKSGVVTLNCRSFTVLI